MRKTCNIKNILNHTWPGLIGALLLFVIFILIQPHQIPLLSIFSYLIERFFSSIPERNKALVCFFLFTSCLAFLWAAIGFVWSLYCSKKGLKDKLLHKIILPFYDFSSRLRVTEKQALELFILSALFFLIPIVLMIDDKSHLNEKYTSLYCIILFQAALSIFFSAFILALSCAHDRRVLRDSRIQDIDITFFSKTFLSFLSILVLLLYLLILPKTTAIIVVIPLVIFVLIGGVLLPL